MNNVNSQRAQNPELDGDPAVNGNAVNLQFDIKLNDDDFVKSSYSIDNGKTFKEILDDEGFPSIVYEVNITDLEYDTSYIAKIRVTSKSDETGEVRALVSNAVEFSTEMPD